jgi:chromosome segregation ATPase
MEKPVGELLIQWKSYLTNISSNLMELSDQMEFQIIKLRAKDTANGYTGITKVKAQQCVESVGALWRHFALLTEVIEKASDLNSRSSFLNNTENEVRELLETSLIVIETDRIAINKRNLIGSENNEKKATPGELLKYMQESFEDVCSIVTEISKAAETVDIRLSNIKVDIERLNSTAKRLGLTNMPSFAIDKAAEIENNPLQGAIELDNLVYAIEKYRASIKAMEAEYNNLAYTLNKVRNMLSELKDLAASSKDAAEKSQKVFGSRQTIRPAIGEDILKSLEDWLQILERKLSEGHLNAAKIGVSKLEQECSLKLKMEKENYYCNNRDYNEWLDLKGHFNALCAKANALKAKGLVLDNSLNQLMESTQAVLYANVVSLDRCRQLVRKFEMSLKT